MAHSKWKPKFKKEKKIGILDKTNTNKQTKMLNTVMAFTFMGKTADLTDVQQAVPQGGGEQHGVIGVYLIPECWTQAH